MSSDNRPVRIPTVQVRPNMLVIYDTLEWPYGRPKRSKDTGSDWSPADQISLPDTSSPGPPAPAPKFDGKPAYSGLLCPHAKKRLTKALNLLVAIAQPKTVKAWKSDKEFTFKVNFITLTLPSPQGSITDKELKKSCLDPWIKSMRRKHDLRSYVWRAERQFNGNLHFHITSDTYLPLDSVRDTWNRQLRRIGLMDAFREANGHERPNSTDIHSVQRIKNLAAYMVKYMSKDPEQHLAEVNAKRTASGDTPLDPDSHPWRSVPDQPTWTQPIAGKVWDCSRNLKLKARCETVIDTDVGKQLQLFTESYPDQCKQTDHCFLIFTNGVDPAAFLTGYLLKLWLDYLDFIRDYAYDTMPDYRFQPDKKPPEPVSNAPKLFTITEQPKYRNSQLYWKF